MPADTKQLISDSFMKLLQNKKLEDITVTSLADYCGISRQTFYYHFQDIMSVIEWTLQQVIETAVKNSSAQKDPEKGIREIINNILTKQELIQKMLNSPRRAEFEKMFISSLRDYLKELFRQKFAGSALPAVDLNILLQFSSYGIMGLIIEQCQQNRFRPESLADHVCRLLSDRILPDPSQVANRH